MSIWLAIAFGILIVIVILQSVFIFKLDDRTERLQGTCKRMADDINKLKGEAP